MKKIFIFLGIFLALMLTTWGVCETAGSDFYNYKGYVVDIVEDENDTIIKTLYGNAESQFTLKWYSREKYKKETKDIQIGDYIMLTTTQYSDTNIKKIAIDYGYSVEGKIFYVETLPNRPFLFVDEPLYGTHLYSLISFDQGIFSRLETGTRVKIYCEHPFSLGTTSISITGLVHISKGSINDFSDTEKDYIMQYGYTIKE